MLETAILIHPKSTPVAAKQHFFERGELIPPENSMLWRIERGIVCASTWYSKSLPTFSDALALVRRFLWAGTFSTSSESTEIVKVPRPLFERLRDIAVYAA